jgi:hypothetical protein
MSEKACSMSEPTPAPAGAIEPKIVQAMAPRASEARERARRRTRAIRSHSRFGVGEDEDPFGDLVGREDAGADRDRRLVTVS